MNKSVKRIGTVMLSGAMLFSAAGAVMNQNIFAGELDKIIEVPAIRQLPNWCWMDSVYMMLRKYLEDNGKLLIEDSIYEKYCDQCINQAESWLEESKSKEEFEQLYKKIFIDKSLPLGISLNDNSPANLRQEANDLQNAVNELTDNSIYKDQAFLVYLAIDYLNKDSYREVFDGSNSYGVLVSVNIVLEAVGLKDKICMGFEPYDNDINLKFGLINYALSKNSSVMASSPSILDEQGNVKIKGHFKIISGIQDDKISVQDTKGKPAKWIDANEYLKNQNILYFIDNVNIGKIDKTGNKLEGIWSINPNKNQDNVIYKKGETITVFLDEDIDKTYLINEDKKIEFTKTSDYVTANFGVFVEQYGDVEKRLYKYEAKAIEDVTLKDLINNYHFDEGLK